MNEAIIDRIYAETLNERTQSLSRIEQIKRYIELYLKYSKEDKNP